MGYFPNGATAEMYYAQYCDRCLHEDDPNGDGCTVWLAHLLHNYDECNNDESILHLLIPRDERGYNERCKMFVAVE